jgi:hypothetical protein
MVNLMALVCQEDVYELVPKLVAGAEPPTIQWVGMAT